MRTALRLPAVTAAALVAGGVVLAPATASAAPPREVTSHNFNVVCEGPAGADTVELALDANGGETGGFVTVYDDDLKAVLFSPEGTGDLARDGSTVTGTFPLQTPQGEPAGTATVEVEVGPAGEAVTTTQRERIGNVWQEFTITETPAVGTGTVQLAGVEEPSTVECTGQLRDVTTRTSQPDATTEHGSLFNLECLTPLADGRFVSVYVEGGDLTLVALHVGDGETGASGESMQPVITAREVQATVPLVAGEEPAGEATVTLAVRETSRERYVQRFSVGAKFVTTEVLAASGTAVLPEGTTVPLDCAGARTIVHELATSPEGPKATGPTPANDAPDGAVLLAPGDRATLQTRATAEEPEVPLWCYEFPPEDPGYYPEHTVWYRFTGTGGEVTVDTAGSSFNTTLSVLEVQGDTETEVACHDDDQGGTWQAHATVDTVAGATYLVQVGGIGGQSGLLKIALR